MNRRKLFTYSSAAAVTALFAVPVANAEELIQNDRHELIQKIRAEMLSMK